MTATDERVLLAEKRRDARLKMLTYLLDRNRALEMFFEKSPNINMVVDPDGTIVAANDLLSFLLERPKSEIRGQKITRFISPYDLKDTVSALKSREKFNSDWRFENTYISASGKEHRIRWLPAIEGDNGFIYATGILI